MADSDDEDFAALLAESERASSGRERRLKAGEVVRGRVISVGATTAFVAVGGKAEAAIGGDGLFEHCGDRQEADDRQKESRKSEDYPFHHEPDSTHRFRNGWIA